MTFDPWINVNGTGEEHIRNGNLHRYLQEKFTYGSPSERVARTFVGPDGLLYLLHTTQRDPVNQLRLFYIELSTQLGYAVG